MRMSLDFQSQDFDPVVALAACEISLPCENVQPLSNLFEYYNVTKGRLAKKQQPKKESAPSSQNQPTTSIVFQPPQPRKRLKNVLTIMEEIQGPLGRLRQCIKERIQVKVWTRRADEIRGVCTGYIVAFDRHWNLIMSDVDETYTLPRNQKTIPLCSEVQLSGKSLDTTSASYSQGEPSSEHLTNKTLSACPLSCRTDSSTIKDAAASSADRSAHRRHRRVKHVDLKQRHVNQIFVRGDNVAFISIIIH